MKIRKLPILCVLFFTVSTLPILAQDTPVIPQKEIDVVKPQPVCTAPEPVPIITKAPIIEMVGQLIRATGGVFMVKGNEKLTASEVTYNVTTQIATLRNVNFTTCTNLLVPDYHLTADEITLLPNYKLHARNVSLYIGRLKVLMLPGLKITVGGRAASTAIFPRIGYDQRDGLILAQQFRLIDNVHMRTTTDIKLTTNHSFEGELHALYGVGGKLITFPGRFVTYGSMRDRALNIPQQPIGNCDPQSLRPTDAARLQPFGIVTLRQRTYDEKNSGLVVNRQPEIGASYVGHQINLTRTRLDPRIELYPLTNISWGRFKEVPGDPNYINRTNLSFTGAVNAVSLGPDNTVQPIGIATYSTYSNGDIYRTWGYGLDITHLSSNGSYYSIRYVGRTSSGNTPFEFDDIDIRKELQCAFQTFIGRNVFGYVTSFDLDNGTTYEWEILLGHRTDCLSSWMRWNQRLKRFSFDVTLINL